MDRVDKDFPRLIALSHPQLRPETTARAIRQYSQWLVDVIDLEENSFKTVPVQQVLGEDYSFLRQIASLDKGDYLQDIVAVGMPDENRRFVLTFSALTKERKFVKLLRTALMRLEKTYGTPVDVEFTVQILPQRPSSDYKLNILQCRPLSLRTEEHMIMIPRDIPEEHILFTADRLIPTGKVDNIRYIVFVDPQQFYQIPDKATKLKLGRSISRLNTLLEDENFILMGPGRWGSTNIDLGVKISYADIYNTKALIEMAVALDNRTPELSYGTHFFQDLVESGIYSLPLHIGVGDCIFNWSFFLDSANSLVDLIPEHASLQAYLRVIDLATVTPNRRLTILMDGTHDDAIGYLTEGNWGVVPNKQQGTLSTF